MIRLAWPDVDFSQVSGQFAEIINSGQLTSGKYVKEFENKLARYFGTSFALTTTSATTALHLALVVAGVKEEDEVLVADFTHPATGNVVLQAGAKPVLVDIDKETFCIDFTDLEKKISSRTKAIIPVHPFGYPVNIPELNELVAGKGITVIEDAATAIGATVYGKKCGSLGEIGCFSFHPRKTLTTGEGGLLTTNNEDLAREASILRNHGGVLEGPTHVFTFRKAGFNYRMTELQAALGLAQLKNLKKIIQIRREIAQQYFERLEKFSFLDLPKEPSYGERVFQSFVVVLDEDLKRDLVIEELAKKGIETTLGTYALHAQPAYTSLGYKPADLPNSFLAFKSTLSLPIHGHLTTKDVDYVCKTLKEVVENGAKKRRYSRKQI